MTQSSSRLAAITRHLTAATEQGEGDGGGPAILYETVSQGRIALLTFNRATRGNAMTLGMQQDLYNLVDRANGDSKVVAIVITGKGDKAFCVGADKEMLAGITDPDSFPKANRSIDQTQILYSPKPVIACVNGACAGIGFVTACMADVRFAVKGAKFTTAFAKRGLVAEHAVNWVLPRIVGLSRAMDLLLSSRVVLTEEAVQMGLVNRQFDSREECLAHALKYAEDMADWCSPAGMAEIKHQVYGLGGAWARTPGEEQQQANVLMLQSFLHPDSIEGIASLTEKRPPKFQGLAAGFIRDKNL